MGKNLFIFRRLYPPNHKNGAGQLYGKPISDNTLHIDKGWYPTNQNLDDLNPYSFKGRLKAFFGFPYKEENGLNGVRMIGFVIKLLPKVILNTIKLFTEISTGSLVAAANTMIDKSTENFFCRKISDQVGWYSLLTLGRILLPISSLLYFTGKSITSPLENIIDTWKFFADMRAKKEWYWKVLGWTLGVVGGAFSVAVTATMYFLLAPVISALGALLATAMGVSSAATAMYAGVTSLFSLMGPVTTFLTTYISSNLIALTGLLMGVVVPLVVAPILKGIDFGVGWVAHKAAKGIQWLATEAKNLWQKAHKKNISEEILDSVLDVKPEVGNNPSQPEEKSKLHSTAKLMSTTGYNPTQAEDKREANGKTEKTTEEDQSQNVKPDLPPDHNSSSKPDHTTRPARK